VFDYQLLWLFSLSVVKGEYVLTLRGFGDGYLRSYHFISTGSLLSLTQDPQKTRSKTSEEANFSIINIKFLHQFVIV
jgi:hypothetical protein